LALGCWLLALGCWLLALGCWLLALSSWLLAVGVAKRKQVWQMPIHHFKVEEEKTRKANSFESL